MKKLLATSALATSALIAMSLPAAADIQITLGSGGLKATDTEHGIQFKMGGRIMYDYINIETEPKDGDAVTEVNDMKLRRARIFAAGEMADWSFKAQFNILDSADAGTPEDLYIRYKGLGKLAVLTLGKQKEPFSLEQLESSKDITLLERAASVEAFAFGRNYGLTLSGGWSHGYYAVGIYEDKSNDAVADKVTMNDPAITARFTTTPYKADNALVHLGAGISHRKNAIEVLDGQYISTTKQTYNVELGASIAAFHAQAEYFRSVQEELVDGGADIKHDGYYAQVGYVMTGEHRGYKKGAFKRIKPESKAGAWEVTYRYEGGYGKYKDFGLGTDNGTAHTAGVNWYANNNVKVGVI
ncbi:MAG: porin, partial [Cellvibrionales bacterium]|nr:porin [Cellvibrionales bacterium]